MLFRSQTKKSVYTFVIGFLLIAQAFGQQTSPSGDKRNSPFAPNPKKKAEIVDKQDATGVSIQNNSTAEKSPAENSQQDIKKTPSEIAKAGDPTESSANDADTSKTFEGPSLAKKTLEVAKRANAATISPTEIYKVGVGDVLIIRIQNAPSKETLYFTVLKDGTIDYPLAGEIVQVAGMTTDDIEDSLKEKIKLYENPQVSVKVREHNSHAFRVLGLVEKPGEKLMQREAIPMFMVRADAIVQQKASRVVVRRNSGDPQAYELKDPKTDDVLIYPGDILDFTADDSLAKASQKPQFYYIGGEISSGGQKDFYQGLTLTQAILASGGLRRATVKKVTIRRKNEAGLLVPSEYDLKAIKDGKVADPVLEAGDTIEVGN